MTLPEKIAFFTPFYKENRGNATTARRLEAGFTSRGIAVEVFAYEEEPLTEAKRMRLEACQLSHVLHFYRFARWAAETGYFPKKPYVITSGGTDVNEHLYDHETFQVMTRLIQGADGFTAFTADGKSKMIEAFHLSPEKVKVIPQSVWFPAKREETDAIPEGGFPRLLMPAGLRPVKDVLFLLDALEKLKAVYPALQFVIVGAALDSKVYVQVKQTSRRFDWFRYEGTVSLSEMKNWYQWADVVVNSSISEGQSSALIEAMALAVPIIARKNEGNASVIQDGQTGLLFENGDEFLDKIRQLLDSSEWRKSIVYNAKRYVDDYHSLDVEIDRYLDMYEAGSH